MIHVCEERHTLWSPAHAHFNTHTHTRTHTAHTPTQRHTQKQRNTHTHPHTYTLKPHLCQGFGHSHKVAALELPDIAPRLYFLASQVYKALILCADNEQMYECVCVRVGGAEACEV
jgi:hypothetical protein